MGNAFMQSVLYEMQRKEQTCINNAKIYETDPSTLLFNEPMESSNIC